MPREPRARLLFVVFLGMALSLVLGVLAALVLPTLLP
jgi:hypothetical protein